MAEKKHAITPAMTRAITQLERDIPHDNYLERNNLP